MAGNAIVTLQGSTVTGLDVRRYVFRGEVSSTFVLLLDVESTDADIDETEVVGKNVVVTLGDEVVLDQVSGIVASLRQHTSEPTGVSAYTLEIVPATWLLRKSRNRRIFQDLSVPDVVDKVVSDYASALSAPLRGSMPIYPKKAFIVQYDETDWEFVCRILADEGIASVADHASGAWSLVDDTATQTDRAASPIPFIEGNLSPGAPAARVMALRFESSAEPGIARRRDYDPNRPGLLLDSSAQSIAFDQEGLFGIYRFEMGKALTQSEGDTRAGRQLDTQHAGARRFIATTSFALPPGTRFTLTGHPRQAANVELLVVACEADVDLIQGSQRYTLRCVPASVGWRPAELPKPRVHHMDVGFVVAPDGEEIDIDPAGRVCVWFRWDTRPIAAESSRRIRVATGWGGAAFGLVHPPRVGEEVLLSYVNGDPDEPVIVGRLHNGLSIAPLSFPAEKAHSIWRDISYPSASAGWNEIRLVSDAGRERVAIRAQLDMQTQVLRDDSADVGRDQGVSVGRDQRVVVQGNRTDGVQGDSRCSVGGHFTADVTGSASISGASVLVSGRTGATILSDADIRSHCVNWTLAAAGMAMTNAAFVYGIADHIASLSGGGSSITLETGQIKLVVGGSSITMTDGEIVIISPTIKLNP